MTDGMTEEDLKVWKELFKPVEGHRRERIYHHDDYDVVTLFEADWILKND